MSDAEHAALVVIRRELGLAPSATLPEVVTAVRRYVAASKQSVLMRTAEDIHAAAERLDRVIQIDESMEVAIDETSPEYVRGARDALAWVCGGDAPKGLIDVCQMTEPVDDGEGVR